MGGKGKRKQYFSGKSNKRIKGGGIKVGIRGFLCSCNDREKECVRESYNLLNKYADILYPQEEEKSETQTEDIGDSIAKELEQLKSKQNHRFNQRDSEAKNFLFIETTLENPLELATAIVKDIHDKGEQQSRSLIRLIPVENVCKAYPEEIKTALKVLVDKYFGNVTEKTFKVVYNHRNNNSLNKDEIIEMAAELVHGLDRMHKVDLGTGEFSIIIEIIKSFAFISVIPDYIKYKKFNLHSICKTEQVKIDNEPEVVDKASIE